MNSIVFTQFLVSILSFGIFAPLVLVFERESLSINLVIKILIPV